MDIIIDNHIFRNANQWIKIDEPEAQIFLKYYHIQCPL